MKRSNSGNLLWIIYAVFLVAAFVTHRGDISLQFSGGLGLVKASVWLAWIGFLAYSIHCSMKENFFRTLKTFAGLYWGRQIGLDLYLGLFLSLIVISLTESVTVALLWLIPILIFANLAVLPYFAIHFDVIAARLMGA